MNAHGEDGETEDQNLPSLLELSFITIANNVHRYSSFIGLPEEIVLLLFEKTLQDSKLTEELLEVFVDTQHESLIERIRCLKIRSIPPIIKTSKRGWLGDSPAWMHVTLFRQQRDESAATASERAKKRRAERAAEVDLAADEDPEWKDGAKSKRKAACWQHCMYKVSEDNEKIVVVYCKTCGPTFAVGYSGNTSNMRSHLSHVHKDI
ncbi:hypothetical protein CYMTET_34555 [Cymbomonas tetramitiformis]|uniref:BED-type domain-containing protein n=1 Tax=Cymbomonas tetramitiformis TaxID=36881 RepID=A0AAE0FAQ3_9CHLO|nr:hypothetical protein CYMTET_34555 [Cymbomonas tetramitiformis]